MTFRLVAAAAGFTGTVIAGIVIGFIAGKITGAEWWMAVGLFAGLAVGIGVIVAALRPIMKSS